MKKNGFTLIELLGVVTILAMLGLIIVPTINRVVTDNKVKLYNVQIRVIKSGASDYIIKNDQILNMLLEKNDITIYYLLKLLL